MPKKIVILGSTGSIGTQVLQIVDEFPEEYQVVGLAAGGSNLDLFIKQVEKYKPDYVSIGSEEAALKLKDKINPAIEISCGIDGLVSLAKIQGLDLLMVAVTGINGLLPTLAAIENKTTIGLANKETIVTAGSLVMKKAKENNVKIIPVDSEHSAIFQCLEPHNHKNIDKLILTASGGPFLNYSFEELASVTPEKALKHPNWDMGVKITIDSAGLINKGLEVIEAHWLFNMPYEKIEVVVHPQSIIHSMVSYNDGSIIAQMGVPDMKTPIQYAMTYPDRKLNSFTKLDFTKQQNLTFQPPDYEKFRGLHLAYQAGKAGCSMSTVYNAANEVAVQLFLEKKISFLQIAAVIEGVMDKHTSITINSIDDVLQVDEWSRSMARNFAVQS